MKKFANILVILGKIFGILAISILIACLLLYCSSQEIRISVAKELSSNIGDFLSGTVGIILTFVSTLFLFVTFSFQREQFKRTEEDAYRTRFEGTFFNMLSMLENVRNESNKQLSMQSSNRINSLNGFYIKFKLFYKSRLNSSSDFRKSMEVLCADNITKTQLDTAILDLGNVYDNFVDEEKCIPGFYFRYIFNIINFVVLHWKNSANDIHTYLNFIQAQLPDEELCLILYDSISNKGLDKNRKYVFKERLDTYSFLENIPATVLLDRSHYKIFPKTKFNFLNADERCNISS